MQSENVKDTKTEIVNIDKSAVKAVNTNPSFDCQVYDFQSKWENGLKLHVARKHSKIVQLGPGPKPKLRTKAEC